MNKPFIQKSIRVFKLLMASGLVWFLLHCIWTIYAGWTEDKGAGSVILVLGNKVEEDGTPSIRLKRRLDVAFDAYTQNKIDYIIVSGGIGKEGWNEARVMASYLQKRGIPTSKIVQDSMGVDTKSSMIFLSKWSEVHKIQMPIYLATDYYHLLRTKLWAQKLKVTQDLYQLPAGKEGEWRDIYGIIREFPAYYYCLFFE